VSVGVALGVSGYSGRVLEELIDRLSQAGVELWTFDGPQDVKSAAGRLGVRAQAMVGAFEIERTGERIREMRRQKAREGYYIGPTPFGYTSQARVEREHLAAGVDDEPARRRAQETFPHSGELYVDEGEAAVVREVFRLYVEDRLGTRAIARRLTQAGLRTRQGAVWRTQQVQAIVKSPLYAGWVTFDEDAYKVARRASTPVRFQERHPGKHPPLVDRDTFERAEVRWRAATPCTGPQRTYILSGFVRCAEGHAAKGRSNGSECGSVYICNRRSHSGCDPTVGGCDAPTMSTEVAEAALREVLVRLFNDPDRLHAMLVEGRKLLPDTAEPAGPDLDAAIARHELHVRRCTDLLMGTAAGTPAEKVLLDRLNDTQTALAELLRQQVARPTAAKVYTLPTAFSRQDVAAFAADLDELLRTDGRRGVLTALAERHGLVITLLDAHRLQVELDVDLKATGRPVHIVWTTELVRGPTAEEWLADAQANAPLCACGCGQAITVLPKHRLVGLPRYRHNHQRSPMEAFLAACAAEGLVTISEAAARLGCGQNTFRRRVERGELPSATRTWGPAQRTFTLVPAAALRPVERLTLPTMAEALGIPRTRLRWLHDQGVLPAPDRDGNGKRLYDRADVERFRGLIASWEATVEEELEAEGWMTRQKAMRVFGLSSVALRGRTEDGRVRSAWRRVASGREAMVVSVTDCRSAAGGELQPEPG
jgi:DNA invertase Pin-like site-specific DNA recombinase